MRASSSNDGRSPRQYIESDFSRMRSTTDSIPYGHPKMLRRCQPRCTPGSLSSMAQPRCVDAADKALIIDHEHCRLASTTAPSTPNHSPVLASTRLRHASTGPKIASPACRVSMESGPPGTARLDSRNAWAKRDFAPSSWARGIYPCVVAGTSTSPWSSPLFSPFTRASLLTLASRKLPARRRGLR